MIAATAVTIILAEQATNMPRPVEARSTAAATMVASRSGLCREPSASCCLSTRVAAMAIPAAAGCRSAAKDIATWRDDDVDGGSERREPLGCSAAALSDAALSDADADSDDGESLGTGSA